MARKTTPRFEDLVPHGGSHPGFEATNDKANRHSGIHIKKSHEGLLHRDTGTPAGQPIPESKIVKAEHSSDPAERKRAVFAENAKHWNHKK